MMTSLLAVFFFGLCVPGSCARLQGWHGVCGGYIFCHFYTGRHVVLDLFIGVARSVY